MRSRYKIYEKEAAHFITSTIVEWIPIFVNQAYFDILVSAFNFCVQHKNLSIFAWVILDNHFHLVCQAPELGKVIQSLKRHTARKIVEQIKADNKTWILNLFAYYKKRHKKESDYQVWQEGFHPKLISSEEMLVQKIEYIHNNPVNRGYVEKPEHWRYSSARSFYSGEESLVTLTSLDILL